MSLNEKLDEALEKKKELTKEKNEELWEKMKLTKSFSKFHMY